MKVGIVIGRFQLDDLHSGHRELIRYVMSRNDRTIVLVGCGHSRLQVNNPLTYESRKQIIKNWFPSVVTAPVYDHKYDSIWSIEVDKLISTMTRPEDSISLYGGRDSFIGVYTGRHKCEAVQGDVTTVSATKVREGIHGYVKDSQDWRKGVIYASEHRFPAVLPVVDIAAVDMNTDKVLMGRKSGEIKWRFPGGFVDPQLDDSIEDAAARELKEETGLDVSSSSLQYLGSVKIDDWRLRKEKDKLMTSFFFVEASPSIESANDDLQELMWIEMSLLNEATVEPEHLPLVKILLQYYLQDVGTV